MMIPCKCLNAVREFYSVHHLSSSKSSMRLGRSLIFIDNSVFGSSRLILEISNLLLPIEVGDLH